MNLAEFVLRLESFKSNVNIPLITKAYQFAEEAHRGQVRSSGDPSYQHGVQTGLILAEQHLDSTTIATGLLHDVIEDTQVTVEQIRQEFGEEIAELVEGVTKLDAFQFQSREEEQAEYFRKMLLSMAKDIRVILIKLADRLHNMRTLEFLPKDRQVRIASETMEIYAPFAHRLGMGRMKAELEDLAFRYLEPETYVDIVRRVDSARQEREERISKVLEELEKELSASRLKVEVTGRAKHYYSIYRKMSDQNRPLEEIYDLLAVRIIVDSVKDSYHVLGLVHSLWQPLADRFFDYIAAPKSNLYRSLHTTVLLPGGSKMEIQIRTQDMHRTAEYGIAAHWLYKEGRRSFDQSDQQMAWLRGVLEWQKDLTSPSEFMENLKIELFPGDIFVYTPKGELKELPKNATPLDFAFAVHTNVGFSCSGAKVNGKLVPLSTPLKNGDKVEILTAPHQSPSQDWLKLVKTPRARGKIKQWLKKKGYEESVLLGKEVLEREMKKTRLEWPTGIDYDELAQKLNLPDWESLLAAVGSGTLSVVNLIHQIAPATKPEKAKRLVQRLFSRRKPKSKGIRVQGLGQMLFRFAHCCQPLPGEKISGFITKGRGISIHRADCVNTLSTPPDNNKLIEVEWDVPAGHSFLIKLGILAEDRKNLLRDITDAISECDSNIRNLEIKSQGTTAAGDMILEVTTLSHLNKVIAKIHKVKGIISVERSKSSSSD